MDRRTIYAGELPAVQDLLLQAKYSLEAMSFFAADVISGVTNSLNLTLMSGEGTQSTPDSVPNLISGFEITSALPTSSLALTLAAGRVYSLAQVDLTTWSALAADSTTVLQQFLAAPGTLNFAAAPSTSGDSRIDVIAVSYSQVDIDLVAVSYYNASDPSVPLSGVGGSGTQQATRRSEQAVVSIIEGTPAATGTEVAPSLPTGYIGLYQVTIAYGQTTIAASNIALYPGAPFLAGFTNQHHLGITGTAPKIDLTKEVSGILPIGNGGSGTAGDTPTAGGLAYGTGSAFAFTGAGTQGEIPFSNATGEPGWSSATLTSAGVFSTPSTGDFGGLLTANAGITATTGTFSGEVSFQYTAGSTNGQIFGDASGDFQVIGTTGAAALNVTTNNLYAQTGGVVYALHIQDSTNNSATTGAVVYFFNNTAQISNTGALTATTGTFSGLLTANAGITATTGTFSGLVTANAGLTVSNYVLTANAGITTTTGAFSGLLMANAGITATTGTFSGLVTANAGLTVSNYVLTANAGITTTTGAFSGLLMANAGITATTGLFGNGTSLAGGTVTISDSGANQRYFAATNSVVGAKAEFGILASGNGYVASDGATSLDVFTNGVLRFEINSSGAATFEGNSVSMGGLMATTGAFTSTTTWTGNWVTSYPWRLVSTVGTGRTWGFATSGTNSEHLFIADVTSSATVLDLTATTASLPGSLAIGGALTGVTTGAFSGLLTANGAFTQGSSGQFVLNSSGVCTSGITFTGLGITQTSGSAVDTLSVYEEGTFTLTSHNGVYTATVTAPCYYVRVGKQVTLWIPAFTGTMGATTEAINMDNLPTNLVPLRTSTAPVVAEVNGGTQLGLIFVNTSSSPGISLYSTVNLGLFSANTAGCGLSKNTIISYLLN